MKNEHEYSGIWILAEQIDGQVQRISYELLTRGRDLADKRKAKLTAIIFGHNVHPDGIRELIDRGADRVIAMQAKELEHFLVEPYAACMLHLIKLHAPEIIIAGATTSGRTLMPYVAVKAHTGLTADCTVLDIEEGTGNLLQTRPAIGGNIMATIKTPAHRPQMATVRPRSTKSAAKQQNRIGEIMHVAASPECLKSRIKRVNFIADDSEHSLQESDVVIAVGHGIKKGDNIKKIEPLCKVFGAALGATRDVVDRGWLDYSHQVGLSGKTVSPKLYIACGISGTIQHLAGMQTSETIVAINKDPDAQIFRVADFGIVGDLFEILPVLEERIKRNKDIGKCRDDRKL